MLFSILQGDCIERLHEFADASFDAGITDPPYGLSDHKPEDTLACITAWSKGEEYRPKKRGFMGHAWDSWVPGPEVWREVFRVLKPGAHLAVFAGARTHDLMSLAIRLAGFECRDTIMWIYATGMPKSKNLSGEWEGWGTALKPAFEPILLFRKPLIGTVTENVLAFGTGVLNIDGCRIDGRERTLYGLANSKRTHRHTYGVPSESADFDSSKGRWPANLIHDGSEEVVNLFPDSDGAGPSLPNVKITGYGDGVVGTGESLYFGGPRRPFNCGSGSAARFFYAAKASKSERDTGLVRLEDRILARSTQAQAEAKRGNVVAAEAGAFNKARLRKNHHPTVKPIALMRYICRLIVPPGGKILDNFCGSGSTLVGGILEGFDVVGIDLDRDNDGNSLGYLDIAHSRALFAQIQAFDEELSKESDVL